MSVTPTPEQTAEVRRLFKNSPLIAKWPDFESQYLPRLEVKELAANTVIFRPGDPPVYLYLVGEGTVRQTVRLEDRVWFERDVTPGQYFGQQGLFAGKYQSRAVTLTPVRLYCMTAANLRVAMERNLDLYEELLHEKRAGRLRRFPVLRNFSDDEVRWLAQVTEEVELAAGAAVPLAEKPGLWLVDWGQVRVTGPASLGRPGWRLTAGNFFVAAGGGMRFGQRCVADSAQAVFKTKFLYIPAAFADRMVAVSPDMSRIIAQPLDIVEWLRKAPLFSDYQESQLLHLAQFCGWEFVPSGQNVTTQGSVGHSYMIIRDGAAVVSALDDRGRMRPRNYLKPGDAYGETSLLEGKPRDATVRAVTSSSPAGGPGLQGCENIHLDRRDLQIAFAEEPELWPKSTPLVARSVQVKEVQRPFDWMNEGETLRWRDRPHPLWLLLPELGLVALLVLLASLLDGVPQVSANQSIVFMLLVVGLFLLPIGLLLALNYYDDYYALTNRRVTRRDRLLVFYDARIEAPVEMVQDVTVDTDFWGRVFDYGDVTVRTAAKVGAVRFDNVPAPEAVKQMILQERAEALAAARGLQKERLRWGLMAGLKLALPIPERIRPLGEEARYAKPPGWRQRLFGWWPKRQPRPVRLPGAKRGAPTWLVNLAGRLPERWRKLLVGTPPPAVAPVAGPVVWRKHWLNLVQRAGLPFLCLALVVAAGFWLLSPDMQNALKSLLPGLYLAWAFLFAVTAGWLAWSYADYHNDIYVLTDDKIIDIEAKPLGLSIKRKEGSLDRVQTVNYKQVGLWAAIFNYGDVIIRTAAEGEAYDFLMVNNPKLVQFTVFQKLDALRSRQEERQAQERRQELIEGLEVYHELRGGEWRASRH